MSSLNRRWSRLLRGVLCIALAFCQVTPAFAQEDLLQNLSPGTQSLVQQFLGGQLQGGATGMGTGALGQTQQNVLLPQPAPQVSLVPSTIETSYYERTGKPLRQFGYSVFGGASNAVIRQGGAVQDDYVLGPGDQIEVDLRGQVNNTFSVYVDRSGQIVLPKLPPISAAGRTFGDVRKDIEAQVAKAYIATKAFVSIGEIRQVTVLVAGEVNRPGAINLTALNSPMDALMLAGGVKKTGSLRAIHILRDGKVVPLDLYGVLAGLDVPVARTLRDGDTIVVPAIGPTVAVTGDVTRPAIYEMAPGQSAISVDQLVHLAGGYLQTGGHRLSITRVRADGSDVMAPVGSPKGVVLHKAEILSVEPKVSVSLGRVVLEGQVRVPGTYDLTRKPSLRALLGDPQVYGERAYMAYAAISRRDPKTLTRRLIPFAPSQVLSGQFDLPLQDDDIIHIFSVEKVRQLADYLASRGPSAAALGQQASGGQTAPPSPAGQQSSSSKSSSTSVNLNSLPPSVNQAAQLSSLTQRFQTLSPTQQQQALATLSPSQRQAALSAIAQSQSAALAAVTSAQAQASTTPSTTSPQTPVAPAGTAATGVAPTQGLAQTYGAYSQPNLYAPAPPVDESVYFPPPSPELSSNHLFLDLNDPAVQSQIGTYTVSLLGAVEVPGEYLAAPGVGLNTLVDAAGGLKLTADLTSVEVTSTAFSSENGKATTKRTDFDLQRAQLARVLVQPKDVIRFREVYSQRDGSQVTIAGQVRYPGTFDLLRGERLSSLLSRAGGLTDAAYPLGAVFLRKSAAKAEEEGYRRTAQELERQVPLLANDPNANPVAIQFIRDTISKLEKAKGAGRIVVDANPADLMAHPQRDLILEPSDYLMIPRRPNTVSVSGEVLSEGAYLFHSGERARYYISQAGGYGPGADKGRTFILLPNGSARPLSTSFLRFGSKTIVPGSTIIVPRDIRPFRFRQFALDLTQVASQLAISAASLSVVSKNTQ
jgi:polysaccharide export outer membrane protein